MIGIGIANSLGLSAAAAGPDPAASAYFAATGITGSTQQQAIDTLVKSLKANNLWSKMKAVYPFVTDNRNLLGYTEDFSNAYWSRQNTSIVANQTTAPNGTLTADQTIIAANNSFHDAAIGSYSIVSGQVYTISFYAKKGVGIESVYHYNNNGNRVAKFNLNDGSYIGNASANGYSAYTSYGSESVGNGWYRFYATFTATSTTSTTMVIGISNNTANTVIPILGNGTDNAFIWGAQLELGSTATTYQPIATTQQAFISSQFKYNLVNPVDSDAAFRLVFNGGWTHSSNGATPNGTNGYADTKLVPNTQLTLNSTHISSYIRNTSQGILLGSDGSNRLWIAPNFNGTQKYVEINTGVSTTPSTTISTATGLWLGSRIVSGQSKLYNNASVNYSHNATSVGLDNLPMFISARNASGNASNYTTAQVAFSSIGNGLTDIEAANLYTAVQAFQTSLSRQV